MSHHQARFGWYTAAMSDVDRYARRVKDSIQRAEGLVTQLYTAAIGSPQILHLAVGMRHALTEASDNLKRMKDEAGRAEKRLFREFRDDAGGCERLDPLRPTEDIALAGWAFPKGCISGGKAAFWRWPCARSKNPSRNSRMNPKKRPGARASRPARTSSNWSLVMPVRTRGTLGPCLIPSPS